MAKWLYGSSWAKSANACWPRRVIKVGLASMVQLVFLHLAMQKQIHWPLLLIWSAKVLLAGGASSSTMTSSSKMEKYSKDGLDEFSSNVNYIASCFASLAWELICIAVFSILGMTKRSSRLVSLLEPEVPSMHKNTNN